MKLQKAVLAMAAALVFGGVVCAEETTTEAPDTGVQATEEAAADGQEAAKQLSEKWTDFQLQVDGVVYQFPMMYADWAALGWTTDAENLETVLEPYQYTTVRFTKDNEKCTAYILNLGINNMPVEECIVGGMTIDSYDWDLTEGEVVLPGGLVRGQADLAAIEAAYGTPSDTYEGDLYTKYTYEMDYNSTYELEVFKESGVLEYIAVENFVEPEGFDAGEASEEVPEAVTAYQKPAELSTDLTAYEIELDGQVYALPVPVSTLLADGWELIPSDTDKVIMANYYGWAGLMKGGQKFSTTIHNEEDYATIPENCWIDTIEVGGYDLELDGALPGGVRVGITEEEFLTILENAGIEYELTSESGDFKYYRYNNADYGHYCEVIIYAGDDGHFPVNTIMKVACSNEFE